MRLVTTTQVTLDGVMQGLGGAGEDTRGGFIRGGWSLPLGDPEVGARIVAAAVQALRDDGDDGTLLVPGSGTLVRWLLAHDLVDELELLVYPVIVGQGTRLLPADGPDLALDLVHAQCTSGGTQILTYRPAGRPNYAE